MSRTKIIYSLQREGHAPVETVGRAQTIKAMTESHIEITEAECLISLINADLKAGCEDSGVDVVNKFNESFYFSGVKRKMEVIENK